MAKRTSSRIPNYKSRGRLDWPRRITRCFLTLIVGFIVVSVGWVLAYRFVDPPITATMVGDMVAGRGARQHWIPITEIDPDMVRAAIAAEDGKFCSHNGFDLGAIENAMKRNASGGRIRGGSTISQQAAKNAFLWQGGGYARKVVEAWFTFLVEQLWGKRRIMEIYLNLAETGVGTYGVNAASIRYYGHDVTAISRTQAARIAAVLPLPKKRGAIAPRGFTKRYGNTIAARIPLVERDDLDGCIYEGRQPRARKAVPPVSRQARPVPGAEFENARSAPASDSGESPVNPEPTPSADDDDSAHNLPSNQL